MSVNEFSDKSAESGFLKPPVPTGLIECEGNEVENEVSSELNVNSSLDSDAVQSGFLKLISGIIGTNIKNVPLFLKKNIIWIGPIAIIWLILWLLPTYFMRPPLSKIAMLLIFLTATYNNFVAKAIYLGFIHGSAIPIYKDLKREGPGPTISRYKKTLGVISDTFGRMGKKAVPVFLIALGTGLFLSNFLSRNNKFDKYLICLITGFIFFRAMSRGTRSIQIRLFKALVNDIFRALNKRNPVDNNFVYVFFSGLSAGFAGSIISYIMYGMLGDNGGYILGVIAMAGGIGTLIAIGKSGSINKEKSIGK